MARRERPPPAIGIESRSCSEFRAEELPLLIIDPPRQGQLLPWLQRTNVWRRVTSPGTEARRLKSVKSRQPGLIWLAIVELQSGYAPLFSQKLQGTIVRVKGPGRRSAQAQSARLWMRFLMVRDRRESITVSSASTRSPQKCG